MIPGAQDDDEAIERIEALTPEHVDRLRLGWWSRVDSQQVNRLLGEAPGISQWIPSSDEYVLVGPWRHRTDIMHLLELVSIRHPIHLTRAAIERSAEAGARLFLAVEMTERRTNSFYAEIGLSPLEKVISYELPARRGTFPSGFSGEVRRVAEITPGTLQELVDVDASAFPWLWRNSEQEFQEYIMQTGVEIYLFRENHVPVGYVGVTVFPGWGHIDRLAVVKNEQGKGYGRTLTEFAIHRLMTLGAVRIGLSTQERNTRSQALYSRMGFKRQFAGDYRIYGRALWQNDSIDDLVTGN